MRVNGMKTNQVIEVALKAGEILLTGERKYTGLRIR